MIRFAGERVESKLMLPKAPRERVRGVLGFVVVSGLCSFRILKFPSGCLFMNCSQAWVGQRA